jgi:hypothetical protein
MYWVEQDEGNKKPDMKLNVPEVLKVILVDDWEAVTKNNQVYLSYYIHSVTMLHGYVNWISW